MPAIAAWVGHACGSCPGPPAVALRDPVRAARLAELRHVLPPRPGGFNALLDAAPGADVIVVAHAGLDDYPRLALLARNAPLRDPITVAAWRSTRAAIPDDHRERTEWLDAQWQRIDEWIDAQRRATS